MMPRGLLVFAAGFGTRMGDLTRDRPKPLVEVAGKPLIDHALSLTEGMDLTIVANVHYRAGMVTRHLAGRNVAFSHEEDLLETGGGLRQALPLLPPGPVFTLNSDAVWSGGNPLRQLTAAWDDRMEALLLLVPRERAVGHAGAGDFVMDASGALSRGRGLVYTGAQILNTACLEGIEEGVFSLNRVWDDMLGRGTLFGTVHDGGWCDVGRPESIPLAEAMLEAAHVR